MLQAFPSKYSTAKLECRTLTALLMGRIARDADASICCCTSPPHGPDLGDAGRTGHTCPLWVQAEQECRRPEGGTNSVAVETAMRRPAALAGLKELFFLLSILLSSRFCNVCAADDTARKKASQGCEGSTERMIWSVRAWGVASVSLALILLFPSLHSWEPAEAKSSSSNPGFSKPFSPRSFLDSPVFKEAPSVRNGINCLPSASSAAFVCDPVSVHVAMTLDGVYLRGSIAAVFSILQHATCPENVVFHFLVTENDREFRSLMLSTFPFLKFKIYRFDASLVRDRISSSVRQALEQPLNYARNYLADLLEPCVGRVIYLDSDLVVVDDISKLWNTSLGPHTIGAPEYCHANFTKYFSSSFWVDAELSSTFEGRRPCYFNTGVMIIDMVKWRQQNYTRMIEQWMEIQKERRIYELGSLPPFLLVFAGLVEPVEHRWNQHGLGGDNVKGSCRPLHSGPVSLLHWSGEGKPWTRLDSRQPCPLDSLWAPYDLFVNSVY